MVEVFEIAKSFESYERFAKVEVVSSNLISRSNWR
jgi:hypothetical protein